jgi:hypothetical protein
MLQVFYLDVSKVDLVLQQVFHMYALSVSSAFKHMLQVFHLDVLKVDRMLHLLPRFSIALHRCLFLLRRWSGICRHPPLSSRCW